MRISLVIIGILFAFKALLFGQEAHTNRNGLYVVENFLPRDYNAGLQNWCALQDKRGLIYVGNSKGILQYDGISWRLIPLPSGRAVFALGVGSRDTIWVGGHDEIGFLAPDTQGLLSFVSLIKTIPDSIRPLGRIRKIVRYNNTIIFRSHKYLLRWNRKKWTVWKPRTSFYRPFVVNGRFYIWEAQKGLLTLERERLKLAPHGDFFARQAPTAILPFTKNRLLIATWNKGVFLYDSDGIRSLPLAIPGQAGPLQIIDAKITSQKTLAVVSYARGLFIFDKRGRLLQHLDSYSGLADEHGNHLFIDRNSDMWLSNNLGISRIESGAPVTVFPPGSGFKGKIHAIVRYKGDLYLATTDGIFVQSPQPEAAFKMIENGKISSWFFLKTDHSLLVATNYGVVEIKKGKARLLSTNQSKTFFLLPLPRNRDVVYAGTEDGLSEIRFEEDHWRYVGNIKGIKNEIRSLAEAQDGYFWLGTYSAGYIRALIGNGEALTTFFDENNGLASDAERKVVRLINGLVFYTPGGMLKRFNSQIGMFYADTILFGKPVSVFDIVESSKTNIGVFGWEKNRASFHHGQWNDGRYRFSTHPMLHASQAAYMENDSISWLGNGSVLIRYNNKNEIVERPIFPTQIRRVSYGDSVVFAGYASRGAHNPPSIFPYPGNSLRFEYALAFFHDKGGLRFQHFLEGYEKKWSVWSTETQKNYTNLDEGRYRFHVRSMDSYGVIHGEAIFVFSILPPLYRTRGAYFVYVVLFVIAVFLTDRIRSLQVKRKTESKAREQMNRLQELNRIKGEARKQVRKKTSADFHDELGHVLTKLSLLTELARRSTHSKPDTEKYLQHIAAGISDLTNGVKDFIWMLDSDRDTLYETLIRIKDFGDMIFEHSTVSFKATGFSQSFENKRIDMDIRRNMVLIFKEAMNNCLKHACADNAEFSVTEHGDSIHICFRDNGQGFPDQENSSGYGLKNMRARADKMGASLTMDSKPGKTEIILKLKKTV